MFQSFFSIRHGPIRLSCIRLPKKNSRRRAIKGLQITRETDYAIRTLLYLSGKKEYFAKAEDIAERMQIPKSFLMKILKRLEKANLVTLKRGVSGGIRLLKNPIEITLYDVLVAMEKNIILNRCLINEKVCGVIPQCPVHDVWFKIRQKIIEALKEFNFQDLAKKGTAS
ncbi:MAG: Rrf2 family transcriptional regulator [Thermodesulfovibrio sp.]|nr:Rrf2 family transcriptional regulator [Thermodesulfovibrio sp.]MCX7725184.1 Rrf2 family transcriptional regulator [Thermodesulfovibrio sp.]